jgi:hypothetical protein
MTTVIQNVIKNIKEVTHNLSKKVKIHIGLLITTVERKTYASMARENGLNYRSVFIREEDADFYLQELERYLIERIKQYATKKIPGYLLLDFTMINKFFSDKIPGVTYDLNGVGKRVTKGFSAGVIFWSNGSIVIPFDFALWQRKKDANELYQKKTEIVKRLIQKAQELGIIFSEVKLDGAFASLDMLLFFIQKNIGFTIRIPENRKVEIQGVLNSLRDHPVLKMRRNQKYKTALGTYKGIPLFFTAHKRNGKDKKKEVVFIVSNVDRTVKEHVEAYNLRWPAEKFFRTAKQSLGLADCQSIDPKKQRLHVFLVMATYTVLGVMKIDQKKKSIEKVLHPIRHQKFNTRAFDFTEFNETFSSYA